jgi:hypothetical protein
VRDGLDVLVALGLRSPGRRDRAEGDALPAEPEDRELLEQLGAGPRTLDQLAIVDGRPLTDVALSLGRLEAAGRVRSSGGWFERTSAPLPDVR